MFETWKMGGVGLDFRLMRVVTQLSHFQDECKIVALSYEWRQYHHLVNELGNAMKMSCLLLLSNSALGICTTEQQLGFFGYIIYWGGGSYMPSWFKLLFLSCFWYCNICNFSFS